MTIVENGYLEITDVDEFEMEECSRFEWDTSDPSSLQKEWPACPQAQQTTVEELSPAGLHPWLKTLFLALAVVVAANCVVALGLAGYELGALLYWLFIGLLTVTTIATLYLAK
jgi:hypothetical protein